MSVRFLSQSDSRAVARTVVELEDLQRTWRTSDTWLTAPISSQRNVYYDLPYLLRAAVPGVDDVSIRQLGKACQLIGKSIVDFDAVIDTELASRADLAATVIAAQACQFEGYQAFARLFPPDSRFWSAFRDYYVEHAWACIDERRYAIGDLPWDELDLERALEIASGKNALASIIPAALCELAGQPDDRADLDAAVRELVIAVQMLDDAQDWRDDFEHAAPTPLLVVALDAHPRVSRYRDEPDHLGRAIWRSGHGRRMLELGAEALSAARRRCERFGELAFLDLVDHIAERYRHVLAAVVPAASTADSEEASCAS